MIERQLEPEVMDSEIEARDYDAMDHREVNSRFAADFLAFAFDSSEDAPSSVLDVGTGTAQIPIEIIRRQPNLLITAIDLAESMLEIGRRNVEAAGFPHLIRLDHVDAKQIPYADGQFDAVISNSIVHHIPKPVSAFREMRRVLRRGGWFFLRDLLRPADEATLNGLVEQYAGDQNSHQQQMFHDSLHAALTLDEVRICLASIGVDPQTATVTSDRHWTVAARV